MNEMGPEASPPPERRSFDERTADRLMPAPEPPLKMTPSLPIQERMEVMVSSTDRMKQAEHCGLSRMPTLNHTGELKAAIWLMSRWVSSYSKVAASSSVGK